MNDNAILVIVEHHFYEGFWGQRPNTSVRGHLWHGGLLHSLPWHVVPGPRYTVAFHQTKPLSNK